jgi:putative transposase
MIRDDEELGRCIDFVLMNPVKHRLVSSPADWPHSSFHRYVARGDLPADWGVDVGEMGDMYGEV